MLILKQVLFVEPAEALFVGLLLVLLVIALEVEQALFVEPVGVLLVGPLLVVVELILAPDLTLLKLEQSVVEYLFDDLLELLLDWLEIVRLIVLLIEALMVPSNRHFANPARL